MPFQLPTGLFNAASRLDGSGQQGLPTGLTQGGLFQSLGQTDPIAQIRQTAMDNLSEINEFKYGSDWKNPNSNVVENLLNDNEGPKPYFKAGGTLSLGENGLIATPAWNNRYDQLYDYEKSEPYYSVYNEKTDDYDRITVEEAAKMSGYIPGQAFRAADGGPGAIYHENPTGWAPSDNGSGYITSGDPYSKYVDQWVIGHIPDPDNKASGLNMDKSPTQVFGGIFNPIVQTYVDQINSRLTPEQIQAALAAGYDPFDFKMEVHDWNLQKALFGSDPSGLGKKPLELIDQLDAWTTGLFEAAGAGGSGMNHYQLPTGLMSGYRRI